MPRDLNRQRDATAVEILGDISGGARRGAAIEHAREEPGRPFGACRIVGRAGPDRKVDGDRWCRARFLRQKYGAVSEREARGRKTARSHFRLSAVVGSNQPMVRFDGARTRAAVVATSPADTAAIRAGAPVNASTDAIVSKYPSWWAMLVTLSLSNTRRARSCAFAFASSASVTPSRRTRSSSASRAPSRSARTTPWVAVAETE